jgi:hypothetical protein
MKPIDIKGKARELGIEFPVTSEEWNLLTGGDHGPPSPEPSPELAALAAEVDEARAAYDLAHEALGEIILGRQAVHNRREANRGVLLTTLTQLPQPRDAVLSDDALDVAVVTRGKAADRLSKATGRYHDAAKREEMRRLGAIA